MRPADRHADRAAKSTKQPAPDAAMPGSTPALPGATEELLNAALRATVATGADDVPVLHDAVRAYVLALRTRGDPPERVLIAVKDRVYDSIRRRPATPRVDASALVSRIVHWAIEAYYRAD